MTSVTKNLIELADPDLSAMLNQCVLSPTSLSLNLTIHTTDPLNYPSSRFRIS
jgi:hypothetical protein